MLNSSEELRNLLLALDGGAHLAEIEEARAEISSEIEGKTEKASLDEIATTLNGLISDLQNGTLSLSGARNKLENIRRGATKWADIKSNGISILSQKQQVNAEQLIKSLKNHGLFIVHKGELESWLVLGAGRQGKGKWVVKAMEALNKKCPEDLLDFVKEVLFYLTK
jgi:hypothetical protein